MRSRARSFWRHPALVAALVLATVGGTTLGMAPAPAAAAYLAPAPVKAAPALAPLPGFQETTVISGLTNPTVLRFAADGRVFVAEKSGRIKVFDSLSDPTPTVFADPDLLTNVHDFWDRGLLGFALDPSLTGGTGQGSYVYVLYAYNHILGEAAAPPRWANDGCPSPPGPVTDGCEVSGRLSRLNVSGTSISGPETVLIEDWCQQFPSHSVGTLLFGPGEALYVSGGDGASFTVTDYGQRGGSAGSPTPVNPCDDPMGVDPPETAEGGALRSQDMRTPSADPVSLDGAVLRLNPATGAGMAGNPFASNPDPNAKRIIAYGLRNPFRMTTRPGTNELWVGDVGWGTWEDIHRIPNAIDATAENFGWPCYEGPDRQSGYDSADIDLCEDLYGEGAGAIAAPIFSYEHGQTVADETCATDAGSSVTGLAFYPESGGDYPASFRGGLFFADHSRDCIWFMPKGTNGQPDPDLRQVFVDGASNPVDLVIGPGGDLFYVNFEGGAIRRLSATGTNQAPTAVIAAVPSSGSAPLHVDFDASGSSDPEGGALEYLWDLDGDGQYDDDSGVTTEWTYDNPGNVTVRLRITDPGLASGTDTQVISVSNDPPVPVISTPSASLTWRVGELVSFSGSATDPQDGPLPASALDWTLVVRHCPSGCHSHTIQSWSGVASESFNAPDHEYPTELWLTLSATDSLDTTASTTVELEPETVDLTFATIPTGLLLTLNGASSTAPFTRTLIVGSDNSVSAPSPQVLGGTGYTFDSWSDGLAQTHDITAPGSDATYTATFEATAPSLLTFGPSADSQIRPKKPNKNFGSWSTLRVRKEKARTYLKFVVTGLTGAPSDAKLRLWVTNPSTRGGQVYRAGNSWTEGGITWNNAPAISGSRLSRVMNAPGGTWVEWDLGSVITGNGTYSFALKGGADDYVEYSSRQGPMDPVLVIVP